MNAQTAYPLSWPAQWPRTAPIKRTSAPFHRHTWSGARAYAGKTKLSMADVVPAIYRELRLIGVGDWLVVISTNVAVRADGQAFSNRATPADPGAAVYFKLKDKPCVLACDKWNRVEDNLSAIARHVEALRGQERWGVGSVEQAFAGYTALPPAGSAPGRQWWEVLGCSAEASAAAIREAYWTKARVTHPDQGGTHAAMAELNEAFARAKQERGLFDQPIP